MIAIIGLLSPYTHDLIIRLLLSMEIGIFFSVGVKDRQAEYTAGQTVPTL